MTIIGQHRHSSLRRYRQLVPRAHRALDTIVEMLVGLAVVALLAMVFGDLP